MAEWGRVYGLKGNASASSIWECAVDLLQGMTNQQVSLPKATPPKHFFWQNGTNLCRWIEDEAWASFDFAGAAGGGKTTLQIIFSKEKKSHGKETFHPLSFYERTDGDHPCCLDFFGLIKERRLIPKKQTQCQVKRIEHLREGFRGSEGLKVMFADRRENDFLKQMEGITESLWFLGAEFYLCDELDLIRIWEDGTPEIRKFKENLSPKLKRQMESRERRAQVMDTSTEFDYFKQLLSPTVAVIYNDEVERLTLEEDDTDLDPLPYIVNMTFELTMESFRQDRKREFKDFLDKYDGKDIFDIQGKAELQAMFKLAVESSLQRIEARSQPQQQTASQEVKANPSCDTAKDWPTSTPPEESNGRLKELEGQNSRLKAEIGRLEEERARLEAENKSLQQTAEALREQLNTKNTARTKRQNEERQGIVRLEIICGEDNLFPDEVEDWLYALLYWAVEQERKNLPGNKADEVSRKQDVLEAILAGMKFDWKKSQTASKLKQLENIFKDSASPFSTDLKSVGLIEIPDTKTHPKYYFYQERYQITFALSPSDCRGPENKIKETKRRFFLMPPSL